MFATLVTATATLSATSRTSIPAPREMRHHRRAMPDRRTRRTRDFFAKNAAKAFQQDISIAICNTVRTFLFPIHQNPQGTAACAASLANHGKVQRVVHIPFPWLKGFCYISIKMRRLHIARR